MQNLTKAVAVKPLEVTINFTLDSLALDFTVRDAWVSLYEVLTLTAVGGYFTLRSLVDKRPRK